MMCSIMDSVSNTLGIDKVNMGGKLILIEEQHDSNANFLLSAVISNALKKDYGICFVLFHNTFNHYHNVGMKFGYNLALLKEKNIVTFIEPIKIEALEMENMYKKTMNKVIDSLFMTVRNEYSKMMKLNNRVIIIIDDLSHLYNFGFDLKQSMYYIRWLRSLVENDNVSQLCILTHTYIHEVQSWFNTFIDALKYMAHLYVKVEPFKTGYSSDASGKMTINWRVDPIRCNHNWPEVAKYIYKLSDRQVQIYASGI
nr:PREDICTED: elongator complex protein 6 [Megachile rotundata]